MLKMKYIILATLIVFCAGQALAFETEARNAVLIDYQTGQCLFKKNETQMVAPASMSKLMTVYMIFSMLKNGSLSEEDVFTVSENAWRKGGAATGSSTMFLPIGAKIKVKDLLKGIIIQSGNDACIVAAENIAGSESNFVDMMQKKAEELGLNNSTFANATGWPHPDHKMSVEDLAKLAKHIIDEFPEHYYLFSEKLFVYNNIKQGNRNPLLYSMPEADGLKTGHTEEAGFSLVASAKRANRRLIAVVTGLKSNKQRSEETEKMLNYGFREFKNYSILSAGKNLFEIPVVFGQVGKVNVGAQKDVLMSVPRMHAKEIKVVASYNKPVRAPIVKGQELGSLKISIPETEEIVVPLVANEEVKKVGWFGKMKLNIKYLLTGAN